VSSHEDSEGKGRKLKKEKHEYNEEDIKSFCKNLSITYSSDREKLVINLALQGQEELNTDNVENAEVICKFLLNLSEQWKDGFSKMKALLLRAQLASFQDEDPLVFLNLGLKESKKLKLDDITLGIRVQIAFEKFRNRDYKGVLKEIKEIEKISEINEENTKAIAELKARSYWELDDYNKGFKATLNWYYVIKDNPNEISILFMAIVYLLTVMSSISLPYNEDELKSIRDNIKITLSSIATSTHLYNSIIPNIDTLFGKSLMLVEPEILHEFTDLFLQTSRWMDEEKYLFLCQKLADAFYNINDFDKSLELMDKAHQYIKEKKYDKIEPLIRFKKAEFSSLIFYFMAFDPLFDPYEIKSIQITEDNKQKDLYLQVLSAPINSFPATSYSQFLRIVEKANKRYTKENSMKIQGIDDEEERCFFVLDLQLADESLQLLMKEDFQLERKESQTLHSTISPYYSLIGLLSDKESEHKTIKEIEDIESILLKIQRAINCPASKAVIYLPETSLQLNLFKYYLDEGGFKDIKTKILDTARSLHKQYDFAKNHDFLQIFQSDPITVFDLSLREPEQLSPLTNLIKHAYGIVIDNSILSQFLKETMSLFLKRSDARFWKDFYYQYSWLQIRGEFTAIINEDSARKSILCDQLLTISEKLNESEKILESNYFKAYLYLVEKNKSFEKQVQKLTTLSEKHGNKKYAISAMLMENLMQEKMLDDEEFLRETTDLFCLLCEFKDWNVALELFIVLLDKIQSITKMFEICKTREVKDTGILLYLHLSRYLVDLENYSLASSMLMWIIQTLNERKDKFFLPLHTWNYLFVKTNLLLYEIFEMIPEGQLKNNDIQKDTIVKNLLDNFEWIDDPLQLTQIIKDQIDIFLIKKDLSLAEKHYHWIEQILYYSWDLFTAPENQDLLRNIQSAKKRIESHHFT